MAHNILGVNLNHNSSIALISDGELIFYLEEERLSRNKNDNNPYLLLKSYLQEFNPTHFFNTYRIDQIISTGCIQSLSSMFGVFLKSFHNFFSNVEVVEDYNNHHYHHACCAFLNSGFKNANNIVLDFGGSVRGPLQESESIFYFTQNFLNKSKIYESYNDLLLKSTGITKTYSSLGLIFGISSMEGGKLMGLSSYGKKNNSLPLFFKDGKGNPKLFQSFDYAHIGVLGENLGLSDWMYYKENLNNKTLSQTEKDVAYKIQQDSQEEVAKLVEIALQTNNCNNITLSGGFALNCVNNYFLKKNFPNVNFYFEPISHDGGTAIGAAYSLWYQIKSNPKLTSLKSLYLGPQYSKEQLLEGIKKYVSN